jgi:SAM-dependent MidA family methyltransferase
VLPQEHFALLLARRLRYRWPVTGNPLLLEQMRREMTARGGRITFCRFMELALYHPQHGYYTSGRCRIGREGDYLTSVSVGPLLGRILARQFHRWGVEEVYEFGGHRGQLRADVLAARPQLNYRMIEVGAPLPATMRGVVFSNELLDALPVHRVCGEQEVYVNSDFVEELGPHSDPRLPRLPDGYRSEINLRALDWLADVASRLEQGRILTIDYGFDRAEYFAPYRVDGHLQCYYRHTRNADPYQHIGEQDITAHVEFTSLIEHGERLGLETVLFADQAHYLMEAGAEEIAEIVVRDAGKLSPSRNAIHQLLHSTMGRAFRVLVQQRA